MKRKGYTTITIPTKPYIKAYIQSHFGEVPTLSCDHLVGRKLYDLLEHSTNEFASEYSESIYTDRLPIFISYRLLVRRGDAINETNIRNFNQFMEDLIKKEYFFIMDSILSFQGKFVNNYRYETRIIDGMETEVRVQSKRAKFAEARKVAREILGIDESHWPEDSMKKAYDRRLSRIERGEMPMPSIISAMENYLLKTVKVS